MKIILSADRAKSAKLNKARIEEEKKIEPEYQKQKKALDEQIDVKHAEFQKLLVRRDEPFPKVNVQLESLYRQKSGLKARLRKPTETIKNELRAVNSPYIQKFTHDLLDLVENVNRMRRYEVIAHFKQEPKSQFLDIESRWVRLKTNFDAVDEMQARTMETIRNLRKMVDCASLDEIEAVYSDLINQIPEEFPLGKREIELTEDALREIESLIQERTLDPEGINLKDVLERADIVRHQSWLNQQKEKVIDTFSFGRPL